MKTAEILPLITTFFSLPILTIANYPDRAITIGSENVTNWGDWGPVEYCPDNSTTTAAQLKVEAQTFLWGSGDDTALNGIRLYCGDPRDQVTITSSEGPYGEWLPLQMICPLQIKGFDFKVEQNQHGGDDTSANNIKFLCLTDKYPQYKYMIVEQRDMEWTWGKWNGWILCPQNYAICGIQTQVEPPQGSGDDSGLNNVRFKCCPSNKED